MEKEMEVNDENWDDLGSQWRYWSGFTQRVKRSGLANPGGISPPG
jgi:hypothetical protein